VYLARLARAKRFALYQVVAKRWDAEAQGLLRLTRLLDTLWRRAGKPKRRTARVKRWRGAPHRKKLLPPGQRQRRTAGSQRARGAQGKGGATPVPARVEELLAWVRRVMERPSEEDVFTTVLHLLKSV
jgi:hypothetical protein